MAGGAMTADVVKLPPADPIFALAPELKLHQSKIDGALVVNSREVARLFFRGNHRELIRHIMWSIWNDPMRPNYHDEFRQCPDGSVDMTSHGLLTASSHWGFEYEESERLCEFSYAWINSICARMREVEAKTGVNPIVEAIKKFFPGVRMGCVSEDGFHRCCDDCQRPLPAGPMLVDELWAMIAEPGAFLCFACIEKRLGRQLTQADLIVCAFNAGWMSFDGADVAAMRSRAGGGSFHRARLHHDRRARGRCRRAGGLAASPLLARTESFPRICAFRIIRLKLQRLVETNRIACDRSEAPSPR